MNYPILRGSELFHKADQIYVKKSTSVPEYVGKMHTHNFIEISYIVSGACIHTENGISTNAKKGDLFIINYGVPHQNVLVDKETVYVSYNIGFTPDFLDSSLTNEFDFLKLKSSFLFNSLFPNSNELDAKIKLSGSGFNEFELLLQNMLDEYTNDYKGSIDLLRAYLIELIIKIFRRLDTNVVIDPKQKQEHYIKLAIQYMQANYSQKLKVEDIAYRSFLSKSYFSQLFKDITGSCFSDYLQKIRIEEACKRLSSSTDTISAIGYDVGFNDMKFFYHIFKKHTGYTPKQYRQANIETKQIIDPKIANKLDY